MLIDPPPTTAAGERLQQMVAEVIRRFPNRLAGSRDERRALRFFEKQLTTDGAVVERPRFRTSRTIYSVLALHLGVAVLGSLLWRSAPALAAALHFGAGGSYLLDSTYTCAILRRFLPWHASRNLVVMHPATAPIRRRIVVAGHVDASLTGWMFTPLFTQLSANSAPPWPFGFMRRQMLFFVLACVGLGLLDMVRWRTGLGLPLFYLCATVAMAVGLALNLQVLLARKMSPGASDNLSGCGATVELARRLVGDKPADVELVFVITTGEEPGSQGSAALVRQMRKRWSQADTTVLALDCLTGGELCFKYQSEVVPLAPAPLILRAMQSVTSRLKLAPLRCWDAPVGMDDSTPFRMAGYESLCLACVDPKIGVSRNYHQPSDTAENLDPLQLAASVDFAEQVVRELMAPGELEPLVTPLEADDYTPPRIRAVLSGRESTPLKLLAGLAVLGVAWRVLPLDFAEAFALFRVSLWVMLGWLAFGLFLQSTGRNVNRSRFGAAISLLLTLTWLGLLLGVILHPLLN
jgi:hypothetical protein